MVLTILCFSEAIAAQVTPKVVHLVGYGWHPMEERDAISIQSCYSGCLVANIVHYFQVSLGDDF